jgi:ADP-ribose pyrophosphatase YjhB (NUDIX family)
MSNLWFRLFVRYFSRWFHTDKFADFFPVSVKGLFLDQGKILLLKNEREEWDLPGGKILEGSDIKSTLSREVLEETNLKVEIGELLMADLFEVVESKVFITIFKINTTDARPIQISKEHISYDFFSLDEIDKIKTAPWVPLLVKQVK